MSVSEELVAKLEGSRGNGTGAFAAWLDRDDDRARIERHGIPPPRCEAWKHTDVNRLYESWLDAIAQPPSTLAERPAVTEFDDLADSDRELVRANMGRYTDETRHPLAAVGRLLMDGGQLIHISKGSTATVRLEGARGAFQYVLVLVEPGASLDLVETAETDLRIIECHVGANASLEHTCLQGVASGREYRLVSTCVDQGAQYRYGQYSSGAELRRNDIYVALNGRGARADLNGAWLLSGRQHIDTHVAVHHNIPDCTSRQLFRGVAADRTTAVFEGRIYIAPNANGSDATLSNKNLLQSADAQTYTKPELEIYAHDVKCAHGATVGKLDEGALFYLRSRGIEPARANHLLIKGFLAEAVTGTHAAEARARLERAR